MPAVGTQHPAVADGRLTVGAAQSDVDTVVVLGERGQRDTPLDDDAQLGGPLGQHGLGVGLGDVEHVGVAAGGVAEVQPVAAAAGPAVDDVERRDPAAESLEPVEHPERREHLQAAGVHADGARLGRRLFQRLDHPDGDAEAGELDGGGQADRAGPHDQDGVGGGVHRMAPVE